MSKKLNLIGQKIGKLTVLAKAENIKSKIPNSRDHTAWLCQCDCGRTTTTRTGDLREKNANPSCGCNLTLHGLSLKPKQKIENSRLTTIHYEGNSRWLCQCECGEKVSVRTCFLNSGNTKSCGCLKKEKASINLELTRPIVQKYTPQIATARRRWKSYCYQDEKCDLTFEQWHEISQNPCYYCGIEKSLRINCFIKKKDASQKSKDEGWLELNGLDRINNLIPHTFSNCVASCFICNQAKTNRSVHDFLYWIDNIKDIWEPFILPELLELPKGHILSQIVVTLGYYKRNSKLKKKDIKVEIDLQTFYTYSQLPCYYCGIEKNNHTNQYKNDKRISQKAKDEANFYYNGLDRIDSSLGYFIGNILPACKHCNHAKNDMSLADFQNWIRRIKTYQQSKIENLTPTLDNSENVAIIKNIDATFNRKK